ncbi:uncharacterized protein LOC143022420 isoform X2 [Oratosquilla oratoria]|uniref:uncharacterized protein LOC143022420 isoform X2 n=1 Tax=Oratosquilla oratoria TaxID=337810 RepID=UPI003F761401
MEKDEARDIFVEVLHDYRYEKDGRGIAMKQGEIFLVLNRNNADWWQVIRRGELRPFFAPCSYIKTTSVTKEHMKEALSQKMLMENAEPGGKDALGQTQASQASVPPQHPVKSLSDVKKHLQQGQEQQQDQNQQETSKKSATGQVSSGKSHITRIETQMSLVERQEGPQQRRSTFSTFRSVGSLDGPVVQSPKENNSVVYGSHRSLKASPSGSKASLTECKPYVHSTQPFQITSNPSKSSLESLSVQRSQHKFIKAASHDELVSCERSESMFDVSQPKAASSEELDHKRGCKDAGFQSNRLSYHHRSNSVDFRLLHKDLSLSEIKQSSLEKYRRQRLSKDPFNRRKSWAVEEVKVPENVKLTHGEAVDAAIVLDVPPKLPPKQRKNRSDPSGTNLESLRKLEGPVDLCIQGTNKSITATIQERSKYTLESLDREFVPRHELVGQSASLPRIPSKETKDPPVALPRKHLPPTKSASLDSQNNNNNNNKNNNNDSGIKEHKWGPLRKKESVVISSIRLESSNDSMKRDSKTSDPWRSVALESFKKGKSSPTPVKQDERKDNEFQRLSPRNAPTPDLSIMGKTTSQLPPSPTVPPQRVLFDNWGEYLDGSSGRPFFYNASTREKRWKPPRKGIHSVSIPEVPSSSSERKGSSLGRSLPPVNSGSPSLTLNYPNSPNLSSHQSSFSSANLSEPSSPQYYSGHSSLPYQSSDSLGNGREGASVLCHKNSVNGVQFPGTPSTSLKFTSPPVPPSSAKPIYNTKMPSTPTTPDGSFTGEFDDKESVLLDCMDLLETPQGWEKKYDAFSQRVYFQNQTTKERQIKFQKMCDDDDMERLVPEYQTVFQHQHYHCVAEVDIANHANKQYVRKSYQTALRLSKDLQVETDVPKPNVNMKCTHSETQSENNHSQTDGYCESEKSIEISETGCLSQPVQHAPLHGKNMKIPPVKPPRRRHAQPVEETESAKENLKLICEDSVLQSQSSRPIIKKTHHRTKSEDFLRSEKSSFKTGGAVIELISQVDQFSGVNEKICNIPYQRKSLGHAESSLESKSSKRKEYVPGNYSGDIQGRMKTVVEQNPNYDNLLKGLTEHFESRKKKLSQSSESSCTADENDRNKNTDLAGEEAETFDRTKSSDHGLVYRNNSSSSANRMAFSTFRGLSRCKSGSPLDVRSSMFEIADEESVLSFKSICDDAFGLKRVKGLYYESPSESEVEDFEEITFDKNVRKGKQLTGSLPLGSSLSGDPSLQCRARALSEESRAEMIVNTRHEGFLRRTWFMKDGKKQRKNWANMYVRYIPGTFIEGSNGLLFLTRNKNFEDDKKVESFHLYTTCIVENGEKKTSRPNTICLKNGQGCELLLQADDSFLLKGWIDVLRQHEGVLFSNTTEGEDKKGKKIGDKLKKAASVENLNPDNKGIREKLRFLIKRRPTQEILVKKGIYKEAVFGSILTTLCTKDSTDVPLFVLQCIKNIEKSEENLKSDGLYRISGNAAVVQKIRLEVEQRNYAILEEEKDVHNLTGALKLFFRELKEPLIPFVNYDTFIQATASAENRKSGKQAELLEKAVRCLPKQHHDTLRQLLRHLKRVSEYEKVNRMSIMNLAIVLGPCVLWPETTSGQDMMTDVMLHHRVVEGLLHDFSYIFG